MSYFGFLEGGVNIKYLVDNNVNIWNKDAFRWYNDIYVIKHNAPILTIEAFIEKVKNSDKFCYPSGIEYCLDEYTYGDLGKVYGYQWRNQNGVDQVSEVLNNLKSNPYSRYHIINGWNKSDFNEMALPPCHLLYQFIVRPLSVNERIEIYYNDFNPILPLINNDVDKILNNNNIPKFYLDLNMYQRSCDSALGLGFNLASMSLLLMLFAKASNMIAGNATWLGGDTHLYVNHIDGVKEQLTREPYSLPKMLINKDLNSLEDILSLNINDFELIDYKYYPKIDFELYTGLK